MATPRSEWVRAHPVIAGIALAIFSLIVMQLMQPRWETNDDAGMSMVAHGYGSMAVGSPQLFSSNIAWGMVVRALGEPFGYTGYSIAMTLAFAASMVMIFASLVRLQVALPIVFSAVALIAARPFLFPQFTIIAGLCVLAALAAGIVAMQQNDRRWLISACGFFLLGFLIRTNETLLVLVCAMPLLPWRPALRSRSVTIAVVMLALLCSFAYFADRQTYQTPAWQDYARFNAARLPYTDFQATTRLMQRPDLLAKYGYSQNDMQLLNSWFWGDPALTEPARLEAAAAALGPLTNQPGSFKLGLASLTALIDPVMLPLLIAAAFVLACSRRPRVVLAWSLCLGVIFAMGLLGRPAVTRTYQPLWFALILLPLMMPMAARWRQWLWMPFCAMMLLDLGFMLPEYLNTHYAFDEVKRAIHSLPRKTYYSWGSGFPYEYAFPVLSRDTEVRKIRVHAFLMSTYAPYSVATAERKQGRNFLTDLTSPEGADIFAGPAAIPLLATYCHEHLGGSFSSKLVFSAGPTWLYKVRCARKLL